MSSCLRNGQIPTLQCIPFVFTNIINALFILAAAAAVFFIVTAGIRFLTSGGDPTKVEKAKRTMTYAIVGLIVVLLSFLIIRVIANVTNADCINRFNLVDCQ